MAKPYILWDTALNADLITRPSDGPLVLEMPSVPTPAQIERFKTAFAVIASPVNFADPDVHYVQRTSVAGGILPKAGLKVEQVGVFPSNLSYVAPGADPYDLSNIHNGSRYYYANLGYRILLRGYAATLYQGALGGEFRVKWADSNSRDVSQARGAWTGLVLDYLNTYNGRIDHVVDALHGKRLLDAGWLYHAGWLDRGSPDVVDENGLPMSGIDTANLRIVVASSPPDWDVTIQYFTGAVWADLHTFAADFRSHLTGPSDEIGVVASMFAGVGGASWQQETFFPEIEVGQFEPWIVDMSDWGWREWNLFWFGRGLDSQILYGDELKRPKTDLIHVPVGAARGPVELRHSDPELGICMRVGPQTHLFATGNADDRLVEFSPDWPEQLCVSDGELYGPDAPFAFYMRCRLDGLPSWGEVRNIISFGDIHNPAPTANDNGIGMFWDTIGGSFGEFIVRCYTTGGWADLSFYCDGDDWTDEPIDIGFAWTGARGLSIGRQNYELRIVINGVTRIDTVIADFAVNDSTTVVTVGGMPSANGFQGLLRNVAVYGDALTDEMLARSFETVELNFRNPSFEDADPSNRPGEAQYWNWRSLCQVYEWVGFNEYDEELEQWWTALEEFGPGWNNLRFWIQDLDDAEVISALFNAGITAYETLIELFAFWGKEWPSFTWLGPPWRDDFVYWQPFEDTLGPYNGPTGFDSWFDHMFGTNLLPLEHEGFEHAWGNDPFSTAPGPAWHPGTAWDGRIHGHKIEFPIRIQPDKRLFVIWTDLFGVVQLNLDVGDYEDITSLVTMLNLKLRVNVPPWSLVLFDAWQNEEGDVGLLFGYKPELFVFSAFGSMFGSRGNQVSNDARPLLGLDSFGPGGVTTRIPVKAWMFGVAPSVDDDEIFYLDGYSFLDFSIADDVWLGPHPLVYGEEPAVFDSGWPANPTEIERFRLDGWFGIGAEWRDDLVTPEYASFDFGATLEEFDPTYWPDEVWVE